MDVPTANQSQTPCQQWAGQNGWSTASPQGPPPFNPLPSFQHLNLGFTSDQIPSYDHLQPANQSSLSHPRNNTHHSSVYSNNADHSVQHSIYDSHVSPIVPASNQGKNIPPCSLPLINERTQSCKLKQMTLYSPHSPGQAISAPFQAPYTYQDSLNGPQSPHQPFRHPSFGQSVNQIPQCTPQLAFDRANEESAVSAGYIHNHAVPTSPIQQQPQWTLPPYNKGMFISKVCDMLTCMLQSLVHTDLQNHIRMN